MEDATPPAKKHKPNSSRSTPAPPIRATRLQESRKVVADECHQQVRSLRHEQKKLRLQFEKEMTSLEDEVNATFVFQYVHFQRAFPLTYLYRLCRNKTLLHKLQVHRRSDWCKGTTQHVHVRKRANG